jgi:hypothetical protein
MSVVVVEELAEDLLELEAIEGQQAVEALPAHSPDEALG